MADQTAGAKVKTRRSWRGSMSLPVSRGRISEVLRVLVVLGGWGAGAVVEVVLEAVDDVVANSLK